MHEYYNHNKTSLEEFKDKVDFYQGVYHNNENIIDYIIAIFRFSIYIIRYPFIIISALLTTDWFKKR